jgi:hypothetical protein
MVIYKDCLCAFVKSLHVRVPEEVILLWHSYKKILLLSFTFIFHEILHKYLINVITNVRINAEN